MKMVEAMLGPPLDFFGGGPFFAWMAVDCASRAAGLWMRWGGQEASEEFGNYKFL